MAIAERWETNKLGLCPTVSRPCDTERGNPGRVYQSPSVKEVDWEFKEGNTTRGSLQGRAQERTRLRRKNFR